MVPQWVSQKGPSSPQLVATCFKVFSMDRALSSSQMHARSPGMAKHGWRHCHIEMVVHSCLSICLSFA